MMMKRATPADFEGFRVWLMFLDSFQALLASPPILRQAAILMEIGHPAADEGFSSRLAFIITMSIQICIQVPFLSFCTHNTIFSSTFRSFSYGA